MCDVCRNASDESVASAGCVKPCHVAVVQCCHAHQRDSLSVSLKYQSHFLHSNEANYPRGWPGG